ncbi:MAG: hypothetical protein ABI780_03815 [Ardenticatenales bacterium]
MKRIAQVLALLLILVGVVWFLQGVNILPGSFMTGQRRWAINGAIAFAAGVGLLVLLRRKRPSERSELP